MPEALDTACPELHNAGLFIPQCSISIFISPVWVKWPPVMSSFHLLHLRGKAALGGGWSIQSAHGQIASGNENVRQLTTMLHDNFVHAKALP